MWLLGPTPAARGLARILGDLGVPRPIMPRGTRTSVAAAAPERVALAAAGAEPRASRAPAPQPTNNENISEGEDHA